MNGDWGKSKPFVYEVFLILTAFECNEILESHTWEGAIVYFLQITFLFCLEQIRNQFFKFSL